MSWQTACLHFWSVLVMRAYQQRRNQELLWKLSYKDLRVIHRDSWSPFIMRTYRRMYRLETLWLGWQPNLFKEESVSREIINFASYRLKSFEHIFSESSVYQFHFIRRNLKLKLEIHLWVSSYIHSQYERNECIDFTHSMLWTKHKYYNCNRIQ